jgi:hypothetical protein
MAANEFAVPGIMKPGEEKEMEKHGKTNSSKAFLEEVSRYCHTQLTLYRYNRHTLEIDEKYREGRITALNYIADLTFYFMQREKHITEEFVSELDRQIQMADILKSPQYSQGIRDSIEALRQEIEKRLS